MLECRKLTRGTVGCFTSPLHYSQCLNISTGLGEVMLTDDKDTITLAMWANWFCRISGQMLRLSVAKIQPEIIFMFKKDFSALPIRHSSLPKFRPSVIDGISCRGKDEKQQLE